MGSRRVRNKQTGGGGGREGGSAWKTQRECGDLQTVETGGSRDPHRRRAGRVGLRQAGRTQPNRRKPVRG